MANAGVKKIETERTKMELPLKDRISNLRKELLFGTGNQAKVVGGANARKEPEWLTNAMG